jgi:hypothetical protein
MIRHLLALMIAFFIAATTACSSTSTWQLCSDHLTPINKQDPNAMAHKP